MKSKGLEKTHGSSASSISKRQFEGMLRIFWLAECYCGWKRDRKASTIVVGWDLSQCLRHLPMDRCWLEICEFFVGVEGNSEQEGKF